jgi:hypothetical protein
LRPASDGEASDFGRDGRPQVSPLTQCVIENEGYLFVFETRVGQTPPLGGQVLGRFGHSLVHQKNGNVVPHRINPPALSTLQAFAALFQHQRFLADRAGQYVEKVLGNHGHILRRLLRRTHTRTALTTETRRRGEQEQIFSCVLRAPVSPW